MSDAPTQSVRKPMKFPYTLSARIAQFPYRHYWKHNWVIRYWAYSVVLCGPLFWKIQKLSNSPQNVATWEEKKRKEAEEHH